MNKYMKAAKLMPKLKPVFLADRKLDQDDYEKDTRIHKMHIKIETEKMKNAKIFRNEVFYYYFFLHFLVCSCYLTSI